MRRFTKGLKKPDGPIQGTLDEQDKAYYRLERNRSSFMQCRFWTETVQDSYSIYKNINKRLIDMQDNVW